MFYTDLCMCLLITQEVIYYEDLPKVLYQILEKKRKCLLDTVKESRTGPCLSLLTGLDPKYEIR